MRADRLLAMLMLLQSRGRMTARDLAQELEVTERTIYRDLTALSAAGVPVYAGRGPGGGISLLEGYRTNLTGLTPGELRALFLLSAAAPLDQLGLGADLRTALLKLTVARQPSGEALLQRRIHLDPTGWQPGGLPTPQLALLQSALWQSHPLEITYQAEFGTQVEMCIEPYGLVARANHWHLVGARSGRVDAWQVSHFLSVRACPGSFQPPTNFDLAAFWQDWLERQQREQPAYRVQTRVTPALAQLLSENQPGTVPGEPASQPDGWVRLELHFENLETARARILAYGGAIEVLSPLALRLSLADYATQVTARYTNLLPAHKEPA